MLQTRHTKVVQKLWQRLRQSGVIYLGTHRGWYCQSDESYLTEAQTIEVESTDEAGQPTTQRVSSESGHPVQYFEEENFMFRLSAFEKELLQWLEDQVREFVFFALSFSVKTTLLVPTTSLDTGSNHLVGCGSRCPTK